ncbi:MAG: hypothetical protein ICV66_09155 [Chitinophagaceae bacterium]|nr:hypothetical protein [Chitinophagaceae bacterium]
MKSTSATLQFSGYPLQIVSHESEAAESKDSLRVINSTPVNKLSFTSGVLEKVNAMVHQPENWDVDWFNNYE